MRLTFKWPGALRIASYVLGIAGILLVYETRHLDAGDRQRYLVIAFALLAGTVLLFVLQYVKMAAGIFRRRNNRE